MAGSALLFSGCSASRVEDIKKNAPRIWAENGFEIVGYQGYQYGSFDTYGGKVWYTLRKKDDPKGITYQGYISRWGDADYTVYSITAIDAIKP